MTTDPIQKFHYPSSCLPPDISWYCEYGIVVPPFHTSHINGEFRSCLLTKILILILMNKTDPYLTDNSGTVDNFIPSRTIPLSSPVRYHILLNSNTANLVHSQTTSIASPHSLSPHAEKCDWG